MKKLYSIFTFIFTGISLFAQPVLNEANIQTGVSFNLYNVSNVNPASLFPSGANVNWDLSTSTSTLIGKAELLDIAATPHAAQYPAATTALKFTMGGTVHYSLFKVASGIMEEVANNVGTPNETAFTNPRTTLIFPFTYGSSTTDTYQKSGQAVKTNVNTYDAYGSIGTTLVTHTNVVRIFNIDNGDTAAYWWNSNPVSPAFQANSAGFVIWHNPSTGISDNVANDLFEIFPNPATNQLTIINKKTIEKVEIFSINGQLQITTANAVIDISGLSSGTYFLKATSNDGAVTTKFVKQ